jgi:uncharacterized membrane protein YdbT with pleckstrin-like domain
VRIIKTFQKLPVQIYASTYPMRANLKPTEKLIIKSQKHWILLLNPVLIFLLFIIITITSFWFNTNVGIVSLGATCIPLLYLIWKMLERKYDIWVVTNLRIIDESGVLSHNAKESPIDKINNISFIQTLGGRLLGYGDVQIQTAAEAGITTYYYVSNPRLLTDTVTKCHEDFRHAQMAKQAEQLANAIKSGSATLSDTKECPYCAEIIKAKARLCRFCGRELV